jgi:hypothetical protein
MQIKFNQFKSSRGPCPSLRYSLEESHLPFFSLRGGFGGAFFKTTGLSTLLGLTSTVPSSGDKVAAHGVLVRLFHIVAHPGHGRRSLRISPRKGRLQKEVACFRPLVSDMNLV